MGVLARPFGIAEWVWAASAAVAVFTLRLLSIAGVGRAIGAGSDVYFFLAGMMVLSELARREGLFTWLAALAARASHGSAQRLFALVYGVGIAVTIVLSNDATAVVLTPAVAAAARTAGAKPLPYLFACAFVANAASFVLPISNPANLVVFAHAIPPLGRWLIAFALPSLCSIAITYAVLAWSFRSEIRDAIADDVPIEALSVSGRLTLAAVVCAAIAIVVSSALGANLGVVTSVCALVALVLVAARDRGAIRDVIGAVSWSTLVLVAALFVLVGAAERTGLLAIARHALGAVARLPAPIALPIAAFAMGLGSNVINNLPAGLIAGTTIAGSGVSEAVRSAIAIGIDLGPNLSVTGSLATILWLLALRREGIAIDPRHFLRVGAIAMPAAMIAAVESLPLLLH